MKNKRGIYLLALILSLATVVLLSMYIQGLKKAPEKVEQLDQVIVAVADIPAQTKITEEMLTTKALPKEAIHPLAAKSKQEIVGSLTTVDITAQEQFLTNKVALDDVSMALSFKIPEGMRAIALPVTEIYGVAGYLEKDDRVDLLISYELPLDPEEDDTPVAEDDEPAQGTTPRQSQIAVTTFTQLQNLEVLEVGPLTISEEGIPQKTRGVTTSVVLLANPEQAEMIAYAVQTGVIQLTLRNPLDHEILPQTYFNRLNIDEWRRQ